MAAGSGDANVEEIRAADSHQVGGGHDHEHDTGHDHADEHAAGHGESHDGEPLGPTDWRAWGFALLGVGASALVGLCLLASINQG